MDKFNHKIKGQSLVEIIVAIAVAGVLIGGTTMLISVVLQESKQIKITNAADNLAQEYLDKLQSISEGDWHKIYCLPSGDCGDISNKSNKAYYIDTVTNQISSTNFDNPPVGQPVALKVEIETIGGAGKTTFYRYFTVEKVCRNSTTGGDIVIVCPVVSPIEDPSTQKITVVVLRDDGITKVIEKSQYLTRHGNIIFNQTDWSGGFTPQQGLFLSNGKTINNKFFDAGVSPTGDFINFDSQGEIKIKDLDDTP